MDKGILIILLITSFFTAVSAQSATNLSTSIEDSTGSQNNFVLGRPVTSTFEYEIIDPFQPIDTALVIDDSGSMGSYNFVNPAIEAAKSYVDETSPEEGDRNSVVFYGTNPSIEQTLTPSKQSAKDAIEGLEGSGGTNLPGGVSSGTGVLDDGNNQIRVMIVLGDGESDYTDSELREEVDNAENKGIEIHGVMLGGAASTSDFSIMTGNNCQKETAENNDGDTCWYAESGSLTQVYESIQGQVEQTSDVDLRVRLDDMAYPDDSYDGFSRVDGNQEYLKVFNDVGLGVKRRDFQWRPTDYSVDTLDNKELITGDSVLEVLTNELEVYQFNDTFESEVRYVDFAVEDYDVWRGDSNVNFEVEISNIGNEDSLANGEGGVQRFFSVDSRIGSFDLEMPVIPSGESRNLSFRIPESNNIVDGGSVDDLELKADSEGYWESVSDGRVSVSQAAGGALEPNEQNNRFSIGFPPLITSIDFTDIDNQHAFRTEATVSMLTDGSDIGECRFSFLSLENGERYPSEGMLLGNISDVNGETARCSYDNFNDSLVGFQPNDEVRVNVTVENDKGVETWDTDSHEIINRPPVIGSVSPENDGYAIPEGNDVTLEANIRDPESDDFDVEFRDTLDNLVIDEVTDAQDKEIISTNWERSLGRFYWSLEATDEYGESSSRDLTFTRLIGDNFRLRQELDMDYNSVITTEDSTSTVFVEVVNLYSEERGVVTEVNSGESLETDLVNYDSSVYQLEGGESRRFQIDVEAKNVTGSVRDSITVVSTGTQTGAITTQDIPIFIRDNTGENRSIPGLTAAMIYVIGLVSVLLFGLSV